METGKMKWKLGYMGFARSVAGKRLQANVQRAADLAGEFRPPPRVTIKTAISSNPESTPFYLARPIASRKAIASSASPDPVGP